MIKELAFQLTRFMWRRIDTLTVFESMGPVILTWAQASGRVEFRVGVWHTARKFNGEEFGPGFTCYWSGAPLTDKMTYWAPCLLVPLE